MTRLQAFLMARSFRANDRHTQIQRWQRTGYINANRIKAHFKTNDALLSMNHSCGHTHHSNAVAGQVIISIFTNTNAIGQGQHSRHRHYSRLSARSVKPLFKSWFTINTRHNIISDNALMKLFVQSAPQTRMLNVSSCYLLRVKVLLSSLKAFMRLTQIRGTE